MSIRSELKKSRCNDNEGRLGSVVLSGMHIFQKAKISRYRGEVSNAMKIRSINHASLFLAKISRITLLDA